MDRLRFTILGCGSSGGVPRLGGTGETVTQKTQKITGKDARFWFSA